MKRFAHEEQSEAANEYWGRREAERFRPYRFDELPPLPPVRTPPPFTWKSRQQLDDEWEEDYRSRPPCSAQELEEFRIKNHLTKI